jgi:DNA-binding MarR family transcriptional regulator
MKPPTERLVALVAVALDLIERSGPLTASELGEQMDFAPASVTAIVDRLEAKQFLRRLPHPVDGRRLLIEFDPTTFERLAPMYEGLAGSLTEMLDDYSESELELIQRVFTEASARQHAAALELIPPRPPARPACRTHRRFVGESVAGAGVGSSPAG